MNNLLDLKFWFDLRAGALTSGAQNLLIIFILILAIISVILYFFTKKKKGLYHKTWKRLYSFSNSNLVPGVLLLFFTYETIPFLSARFWFLVWGAEMLAWLVFIIKNSLEIPKKRELIEKDKEFKKYIP
jgi:amino acid transporter